MEHKLTPEEVKLFSYESPLCKCKTMGITVDEAIDDLAMKLRGDECIAVVRMKLELQLQLIANMDYARVLATLREQDVTVEEGTYIDNTVRRNVGLLHDRFNEAAKNIMSCSQEYIGKKITTQLREAYNMHAHLGPETDQ